MTRLLILSLLLASCLDEPQDQLPNDLDGKADHIGNAEGPQLELKIATKGCGPSASSVTLDGLAFTTLFDYAVAESGQSGTSTALDCVVQVHYQAQPGWRMRLPALDVRGWAGIEDRAVTTKVQLRASFSDTIYSQLAYQVSGFGTDIDAHLPSSESKYSNCDGEVQLELAVASDPGAQEQTVWLQIDSFDIVAEWERCL